MSLKIRHKRSGLTEVLSEMGNDMQTLDQVSGRVVDEIIKQNADVNLQESHEDTVITTSRDRVTVGSKSESYAQLLRIDDPEPVLEPYREHIRGPGRS